MPRQDRRQLERIVRGVWVGIGRPVASLPIVPCFAIGNQEQKGPCCQKKGIYGVVLKNGKPCECNGMVGPTKYPYMTIFGRHKKYSSKESFF